MATFRWLKLGALLAGGGRRTVDALARVAAPLGVAFQLRDDLLGAFGSPSVTGKPMGNDLLAGKRTVLVAEGLRRAKVEERKLLAHVLGNARAKPKELKQALHVLESSGARTAVEERIRVLKEQALAAIDTSLTPLGSELLSGAIQALTARHN